MKLPSFKRIIKEDFPEDNQELVDKLAYPINSAFDTIYQAFNRNIDFNNLNQSLMDIDVKVDANGIPTSPTQIRYDLKGNCKGFVIINVKNNTSATSYPTAMPLISFQQLTNNLIRINHVSGLTANSSYTLSVIMIAN